MQATSQNRQLKQKTHKDAEIRISSIMESISTTKKKKKKKTASHLKEKGENHVHYRHCRCGAIQRGYRGKQTGKLSGFWISPSGFSQNTRESPPPAANYSTIYFHWIPSHGTKAGCYSMKNEKKGEDWSNPDLEGAHTQRFEINVRLKGKNKKNWESKKKGKAWDWEAYSDE